MADSFTTILRLRQQATGANNNVWGALLNASVFQLVEDALAGRLAIVVAGVDITLSTNNGSNDQARMAIIALSGSPSATRNIIIPNVSKWYIVDNQTNAIQNVKTSGGTALPIAIGERKLLFCDAANGIFGVADTLGGLDSSAFAKLASRNSYSAGNSDVPRDLVDGATVTMDLAVGNVFKLSPIAGNRTLAITNPNDGSWVELYVTQDSTGGRTLDFPATIIWEGGSEPVLIGLPNVTEGFAFRYDADTTSYFGRSLGAFAPSGGGTVASILLDVNEMNVDIFDRAGRPAGAATVTVRISNGVMISSLTPGTPALDFTGFVAGSQISIINEGYIIGAGGQGGNGGGAGGFSGNDPYAETGRDGFPGGDAIRLPSTACTTAITNANGHIWGGGGGGGGGGGTSSTADANLAAGGGGGGGAGGGRGGQGMSFRSAAGAPVANATSGATSSTGRSGTFGAKGIGANFGTADGGDGGDGGDWGTAGSSGESPTAQALDGAGGSGGAAGKAVNVNGGTAPTFVSGSGSPNTKGAVA